MEQILILLPVLALCYLLGWLFIPKGNFIHELWHLPPFWLQVISTSSKGLQEERVSYGKHARQYFLFYQPAGPPDKAKLAVLYFHGGGWRFGRPEQFRSHARMLSRLGYAVLLPSHRRTPRYSYLHIRDDLDRLLQAAYAHLRQKGLAHCPVVIGGMSAGGNVAALAAFRPPAALPDTWIRGLFALGAPLNLEQMPRMVPVRHFAGTQNSGTFRDASPINYLQAGTNIPTLIIHGKKDGMVPYDSVVAFAARMLACNLAETRFITIPGGTHLIVASWVFQSGITRTSLLDWMKDREIPGNEKKGLS